MLDLQADQSASRQLGRKGERKDGSFEQGGARPAGRAFGQLVGRWGGRYTPAVGGGAEHESLLGSGKRHLKDGDVLVLMKSLGKVRNKTIFNRTSVELRLM